MDAFIALAPSGSVQLQAAIFPKTKASAQPIVRCVSLAERDGDKASTGIPSSFEVTNVDSVDKVYRVLTKHMHLKTCDSKMTECLKWKYKANGFLETGKANQAIDAYDKALAANPSGHHQEGIILLMRASAYLQRAALHKEELKRIVDNLVEQVPEQSTLPTLLEIAADQPLLARSIFEQILLTTEKQAKVFQKTQYRHGLYQYALLQAAQDSLRSTQLLPTYSAPWVRAGDTLRELWRLQESTMYYERAIELDKDLEASISPVIEQLRKRQELLDNARAFGWSEDTLRLALDVAG